MASLLQHWLEKATWTTADITAPAGGGLLSPEQAKEFLRVVIEASVIMKEARTETSNSPKFEVPRISFGSRILRAGTEGARLADADRVKPTTGLVTLSTVLFRGEVPVSDELFEDNVEKEKVADTIVAMLAEAVSRDIEEIAIKSDTARTASELQVFDQLDGIIKSIQSNTPSGQKKNMTGYTTYTDVFSDMVAALPPRYRRNPTELRLYVPYAHLDGYQRSLAARGTGLGDQAISDNLATKLAFRGIPVVGVPMLSGTDQINGSNVDYSTFAILAHPQNIIFGFHRQVRIEQWRDPREGVTSFLPSVRFDVKIADPEGCVLAYNLPASLS
jgi:HK97 family phage major capsid protein